MSPSDIAQLILQRFGPHAVTASSLDTLHPWIAVPAAHWLEIAAFLRNDHQLQFDLLRCLTGLDYPDRRQLCAAYDLLSFDLGHELCIKVSVPRDHPEIPSVAHLWRAADWHERETFDLLGIRFTNHPDSVTDHLGTHPRRILLPDDWVGHPLRKDYAFPREYHGIPGSVELDWAQKSDYPK